MTESLDDEFTPFIQEMGLQQVAVPSVAVATNAPMQSIIPSSKLPPGDARTAHDDMVLHAVDKYRRALQRSVYPYGRDPYTKKPLPDGKKVIIKPQKELQKMIWKRAYKKSYKKFFGTKPPKGEIPMKPSFKRLYGGAYAYAQGVPYDYGGSMAKGEGGNIQGGSVAAAIAGLAVPLLIKYVPKLISLVKGAIDKKRAKRAARSSEGRQDAAAAEGAGKIPTPYQMEQAKKVADAASSRGAVGFPNPLSYPEYPPSLMDLRVPLDALTFWREVYNKIKMGLTTVAQATKMPPRYAIPYIDALIKAHATATFGSGAARALLETGIRSKPMKVITPHSLLFPMYKRSVRSPADLAILKQMFAHPALRKPVEGHGIEDIMTSLHNFMTGALPRDFVIHHIKDFAEHLSKYLIDKLKDIFPDGYTAKEWYHNLLSGIVGEEYEEYPPGPAFELMPPTESTASETGEGGKAKAKGEGIVARGEGEGISARGEGIVARGDGRTGSLIAATGGALWDTLKTLGLLVTEVGMPVVGALINYRFKTDKNFGRAVSDAAMAASNVIGDYRKMDQVASEHAESLKAMDEKAKEIEDAAKLVPDLYIKLKEQAELGQKLAEKMREEQGAAYKTIKHWTMEDTPGGLKRKTIDREMPSLLEYLKPAYRGAKTSELFGAKTKKHKLEKKLRKYRLGEELSKFETPAQTQARITKYQEKKKAKRIRKGKPEPTEEAAALTPAETQKLATAFRQRLAPGLDWGPSGVYRRVSESPAPPAAKRKAKEPARYRAVPPGGNPFVALTEEEEESGRGYGEGRRYAKGEGEGRRYAKGEGEGRRYAKGEGEGRRYAKGEGDGSELHRRAVAVARYAKPQGRTKAASEGGRTFKQTNMMDYRIGPTTADAMNSRSRSGQVLMIAKKMEPVT